MSSQNPNTPGAFGAQPDPSAPRKYIVRKLAPPPEVARKIVDDDKRRPIKNPIVRFFKKFFDKEGGY